MSVICVLGLGRMGAALARAFLGKGYVTYVWNRLASPGARVAYSPEQAVAALAQVVR